MAKRSKEKEEQRLWARVQALESEKLRSIDDNKALQEDLAQLRKHYGIDFKNVEDNVKWIDSVIQSRDTSLRFSRDVENLKTKYAINDRVSHKFWEALWNIPRLGIYPSKILLGSPTIFSSEETGQVLLITPETDIRNELVIECIEQWQRYMVNHHDNPPKTQRVKDSRKLDWMPVWEWNMRHPHITRKEIAAMMNLTYEYVKSKLEELDKQAG